MKNQVTINTDNHVYLISFAFTSIGGKFITNDLGGVIKNHIDKGIEYIKIFDPVKNSFKRISKKDILRFNSWNTETYLILKSHSYFN